MNAVLRKSTLVENAVQELRDMILQGEVQPGEFLPSRKKLAARFGVGVSTVHEAIQALTAVGLVDSRPGKGTWVRHDALDTLIHPVAIESRLGELDARQVYEARFVIEVALTELAAQRARPEDIRAIFGALEEMQATIHELQAFVEADLRFHLAVAQASHNDLLVQFYHVSRRLLTQAIKEMVEMPGAQESSIRVQSAIAQAIECGDAHKARQAALDHKQEIDRLLETYA